MPNIQINIKDKVARADRAIIVCDNSDYTAVFDFDDEWSAYETKTARFVYCGTYTDVVFTGNSCPIPVIQDTRSLTIGVYAGDLHTTTPAYISCVPSILFGNGIPADPTPDVYNQIMELLNKDSGIWYPAVDGAGNMSWTRSMSETEPQPVNIKGPKGDAGADGVDGKDGISPAVSVTAITGGNRVTITDAEGAKTFDVMDGAQGVSGADGKDYVLTDTDKQEIAKTAAGLVDVPSVQPDWNQNDETAADYVKNRPGGYTVVTQKGVDIKWDGVIGDKEYVDQGGGVLHVKVSDDILTAEQLSGAEIIQTMTYGVQTITQSHTIDGNKLADNGGILVEQDSIGFMVVGEQATATYGCSTGTYILHMVESGATVYVSSIYKHDETGILPIPEEYVDDAIQRVGADVIIPSSTPGSTKKFRITVDDSGAITATEVS